MLVTRVFFIFCCMLHVFEMELFHLTLKAGSGNIQKAAISSVHTNLLLLIADAPLYATNATFIAM